MKISSDSSSELIRQSDLEEMARQKKIDGVCSRAIKFIGISTKSSGRIRDYLSKQEIEAWLIDEAIEDLQRRGYLDDQAVAARISHQRSGRRAVSKRAMRYYMQSAGLPDAIIDNACMQLPSDIDSARQALIGKFSQPGSADRARMIRFLASRGYSTGIAARTVGDYLDSLYRDNE